MDASNTPAHLAPQLTPRGRLLAVAQHDAAPLADDLNQALTLSFALGSGHGLLQLGSTQVGRILPPAWAWWRDMAVRYVTAVCATPEGSEIAVATPSADEFTQRIAGAPPMTGAEYLTPDVLAALWQEIDAALHHELAAAGVPLIEDAAEALGSSLAGRPAGSFGQVAALSFNGNKLITTSGGGMLVADDEALIERVRFLSTQAKEPAPHYEHHEVGFNYRLSNLLAAFGRGQLSTLDERIARRRWYFDRYIEALGPVDGVTFQPEIDGGICNRWLTCALIDPAKAGFSSTDLRLHLDADEIESRPTWKPMHQQRSFDGAPNVLNGTSDLLFEQGICLPSGSGMTDDDFDRVLQSIEAFLNR